MDPAATPLVDPRRVRRAFDRAADAYDSAAFVQREIAARMLERLDYVRIDPKRIVDVGCGTGGSLVALQERYPKADLVGVDASAAMLAAGRRRGGRLRWLLPFVRGTAPRLAAADAAALPLAPRSVGLLWSNLVLHWLADPDAAFAEMHRVLEVGGLLMFSTFGPDTLKELRACFSDGHAHTQRFIDMHDLGDLLVQRGFADPVMDMEMLTVTYPDFDSLIAELRQGGSVCAMTTRRTGLTGKGTWRAVAAAYEKFRREDRLPASFEVVYGHAWKGEPRKTEDGRAVVRFTPRKA